MNIEMLKKRARNPLFWGAIVAFVCQFGQSWGVLNIPMDWQVQFDALSGLLIALGIWINPITEGILD